MSAYSYTKLFSSITESTVWCEPAGTRLVWITLLAKSDRQGRFTGSVPGLARLANVSLEEAERAITTLKSPDPYSRTTDHQGRRLEEIQGGWRLLNYTLYRDMRDEEARREQNREAKRRERARKPGNVINSAYSQHGVSHYPEKSAHTDTTASELVVGTTTVGLQEINWEFLPDLSDEDKSTACQILQGLPLARQQDLLDELAGARRNKTIKGPWSPWLRELAKRVRANQFHPSCALTIRAERKLREEQAVKTRLSKEEKLRVQELNADPERRKRVNARVRQELYANVAIDKQAVP